MRNWASVSVSVDCCSAHVVAVLSGGGAAAIPVRFCGIDTEAEPKRDDAPVVREDPPHRTEKKGTLRLGTRGFYWLDVQVVHSHNPAKRSLHYAALCPLLASSHGYLLFGMHRFGLHCSKA